MRRLVIDFSFNITAQNNVYYKLYQLSDESSETG